MPFRRVPRKRSAQNDPDPVPFTCEECGRKFKTKSVKTQHRKRFHDEAMGELRKWKRRRQEETAELIQSRNAATERQHSDQESANAPIIPSPTQIEESSGEIDSQLQHSPEAVSLTGSTAADLPISPPGLTDDDDDDGEQEQDPVDPEDVTIGGLIEIAEQTTQENVDFHAKEKLTRFAFSREARMQAANHGTFLGTLEKVFRHLTDALLKAENAEGKWIQVILDSRTGLDFAVVDLYRRVEDFNLEDFLQQLENVLGSASEFGMDDEIDIIVKTIDEKGIGALLNPNKMLDPKRYLFLSRFVWDPRNSPDNPICLIACIAADICSRHDPEFRKRFWYKNPCKTPSKAHKKNSKDWHATRRFWAIVDRIYAKTGIDQTKPVLHEHLPEMQSFLNRQYGGLQLVVYDRHNNDEVIFSGRPSRSFRRQVAVAVWDDHAYWVRDQRRYLRKRKQCETCSAFFAKNHTCPFTCCKCSQRSCPTVYERRRKGWVKRMAEQRRVDNNWPKKRQKRWQTEADPQLGKLGFNKRCLECNRWFDDERCYENHKKHKVNYSVDYCSQFGP